MAIFRYKQLVTIVKSTVASQYLLQCLDVIHHDETTKFEPPGKMRRASRNDHSDFLK